ncbi:hypothetical protein C2857_003615 [Epichloe festucae Fl1]|uniref:CFEM domain-containing protein n=1 Tax=Epichloe festucae (strain Fl1) TaxID=877507 RepID=A0A7S9KP70_EPIFF|nr:hypothetical protein C2857_003615 [Epichloe festucae Fl1]
MKASFVTLAVAGLAAAQNLEGLSPCIKSCIEKSLSVTGCTGSAQEIAACACKPETQAKLATPVTKCVTENKCDPADLVKAQGVSAAQCKAAGGSVPGSGNTTSVATTTTNTNTGTTVPTGVFPTNSSNHTTTGSSTEVATGTNTSPPTSTGSQTRTSGQPTATNGAAVVGPAAGAFIALFAAVAAL